MFHALVQTVWLVAGISVAVCTALAVLVLVCRRVVFKNRSRVGKNWVSIGFFHPYW